MQEVADLTYDAFDLADRYRTPVMVLGDGMLGQMKEPVVFPETRTSLPEKEWALKGRGDGASRYMASLILDALEMERHNWKLVRKYREIQKNEVRYEAYMMDDAEIVAVAYGTTARIAKGAIKRVRKDGIKAGLIRPLTLWPFPTGIIQDLSQKIPSFVVFEMSTGQMVDDVKMALEGRSRVYFHGRPGGIIPTPAEFARILYREYMLLKKG